MEGNKYLAEGIGTFALVFAAYGAIIVNDSYSGALGHLGVSLVCGLIVMSNIPQFELPWGKFNELP